MRHDRYLCASSSSRTRGDELAPAISLRRKLNTFDVTSLVVGSIIGADIYIAAAIGASLVGPASLLVWVSAGLIAIVIALSFAYCATSMPRVGGPYAYVKETSNQLGGFITGWALLLAEWFSLAVFPVAFVQYASSLVSFNSPMQEILLKGAFILIVLVTNLVGIRAAGRFNDLLTMVKLAPLLLLIGAGILFMASDTSAVRSNFSPFVTGGALDFGKALVLIFWAYAGFELSTLPANEIEEPRRTIPKAILTGMLVVTAFYLLTNLVIIGTVSQQTLAGSKSPLMDSASAIFEGWPGISAAVPVIVGVGALISILGADESGTIGTSRLSYALSLDGLLPRQFSRVHKGFETPYLGLIILCVTAFVASVFGGLVELINASVFLLSFVYLVTCLATFRLMRRESNAPRTKLIVPIVGAVFSVGLMVLVDVNQILISLALIVLGLPIYAFFAPKEISQELKAAFLSRDAVLVRAYEQGERFLAYPWRRLLWLAYRIRHKPIAWVTYEEKP